LTILENVGKIYVLIPDVLRRIYVITWYRVCEVVVHALPKLNGEKAIKKLSMVEII
jgi:hypothetical protein